MVNPHITPTSLILSLALALAIVALPNSGLADDEANSHVEVTTGAVPGMTTEQRDGLPDYRVLWPGHRLLTGTVDSISGGIIRVNTGELLPRFLSQREAAEKGGLAIETR
jgi:hypothetical protein